MMGHLNGCMLLGFRNENKNDTLELFHVFEPGKNGAIIENNNCPWLASTRASATRLKTLISGQLRE